jgi:sortase A
VSAAGPAPVQLRKRALRLIGWALVLGGLGVLTWLAWMTLATNAGTRAAQDDLLREWLRRTEAETPVITGVVAEAAPGADRDGPVALLTFVRPPDRRILHEQPLAVVEGVADDDLAKGPGRYPGSALPGRPGNIALAGHRTTHAAPFAEIEALRPGDEIRLEDRQGTTWAYRVVEQRIVAPTDTSVIASDPLGNGRPTLTLTTCHPRFSNRERLVVFAQLVG